MAVARRDIWSPVGPPDGAVHPDRSSPTPDATAAAPVELERPADHFVVFQMFGSRVPPAEPATTRDTDRSPIVLIDACEPVNVFVPVATPAVDAPRARNAADVDAYPEFDSWSVSSVIPDGGVHVLPAPDPTMAMVAQIRSSLSRVGVTDGAVCVVVFDVFPDQTGVTSRVAPFGTRIMWQNFADPTTPVNV